MSSPINPVLSGIMQAYQLAHAIKSQSMQQDALTLQKQREAREASVQDIQTKMQLSAAGAKPVDRQGNYQSPATADIGGVSVPYANMTPAPPGQTGSYGGQQYLIPTQQQNADEAFQNSTRQAQASADIQSKAAINTQKGIMDLPITLPGMDQPVTKGALPFVQKQADQKFQAGQTDKQIASREKVAASTQAAEDKRNAATNATREKTANIRADATRDAATGRAGRGITPGQAGVQGRFDQREVDKAIADHNKMADQEKKLWEDRQKYGDMLKAGKTLDSKGQEVPINATLAAQLKAAIDSKGKMAQTLQDRQKQIRQKYSFGEFQGKAGAQGAQAPAAPKTAEDYLSQFGQR